MKVFLSYAEEDEFIASIVYVGLSSAGHTVSYFAGGIAGGDNWNREVREYIEACDLFLPLFSPAYPRSYAAMAELSFALQSEKSTLPVVIRAIDPSSPLLEDTEYVDISSDPRAGVKKVVDWLRAQTDEGQMERLSPVVERVAEEIKAILDAPPPDRIFIAYSHHQRALAIDLAELLIKNGNAVFYDAKIKAGASWRQTIQKALDDATHVVVIWTPDAAESDEVEREVSYALAERKVIVPILSREIPKLPYHLHGLHYIVLNDKLETIQADLLKAIAQFSEDEDLWK